MATEGEEVAVELLHVDGEMGSALGAVDQYGHTVFMSDANDFLHRIHHAQDVAHVGDSYQAGVFSEKFAVFVEQQLAVVGHGDGAHAEAVELPGNDVGVVLHRGDDNLWG